MRLRVGKGTDLVAIVVLIDFYLRFAGDDQFLREHFLIFVLHRVEYDLVGTVTYGSFVCVFGDMVDVEAGHRLGISKIVLVKGDPYFVELFFYSVKVGV